MRYGTKKEHDEYQLVTGDYYNYTTSHWAFIRDYLFMPDVVACNMEDE